MNLTKHLFTVKGAAMAFTVAIAAAFALSSCDTKVKKAATTNGITTIACDASFENILQQEIDVFEYTYKDANIMPYYVDENSAIDSILDLSTRLAITCRELTPQELKYLKGKGRQARQSRIAVDAIALIVNPQNNIDQISVPELADILSGKEQLWNDIWPNDGLDTIRVVFDHQGSSTVKFMRDSILNGAPLGPNVYAQKSSEDVFKAVASNKNAIGIIGVSWISTDMATADMSTSERVAALDSLDIDQQFRPEIKVLKVSRADEVNAYAPYQYYLYTAEYPLTRSIYMICASVGGTLSSGFYAFVTGFQGQKLIQSTGVLPNIIYTQRVEVTK